MSWNERRYSPWLLNHEQSLEARQSRFGRGLIVAALFIAALEGLSPWDSFTPSIPAWMHIAVAAISLPVLYFMQQTDFRNKQQAFTLAMSDRGRRLLFLDPFMEPEEFAVSEQMQGAHLLPLQRQMDNMLKSSGGVSLHRRVDYYYRSLPSASHEGDRLGMLSALHPATFSIWGLALVLTVILFPGMGLAIGDSQGLTWMPLLMLLYLYGNRANTRFAFEHALYNWLRLG